MSDAHSVRLRQPSVWEATTLLKADERRPVAAAADALLVAWVIASSLLEQALSDNAEM